GVQDALQVGARARGGARRAREAGGRRAAGARARRLPRDFHARNPEVRRIAIVAGEASGDALGAGLIRAVKARWPDAQFYGIAGPKMIAEGARSLFPMEKLSVRGYVEVLKSVPAIFAIRRALGSELLRDPPDLFIGVDAPDF